MVRYSSFIFFFSVHFLLEGKLFEDHFWILTLVFFFFFNLFLSRSLKIFNNLVFLWVIKNIESKVNIQLRLSINHFRKDGPGRGTYDTCQGWCWFGHVFLKSGCAWIRLSFAQRSWTPLLNRVRWKNKTKVLKMIIMWKNNKTSVTMMCTFNQYTGNF